MKLSLAHIKRNDDGGTGHHWVAALEEDNGSPAFDGSGVSIEEALCDLIEGIGRYMEKRKDPA